MQVEDGLMSFADHVYVCGTVIINVNNCSQTFKSQDSWHSAECNT
jgi:hypothetical protein